MPPMIEDLDIIATTDGQIALIVPGVIPAGDIALAVGDDFITLSAGGVVFARVEEIEEDVLDALAAQTDIGLIQVTDPATPPLQITHIARVSDAR